MKIDLVQPRHTYAPSQGLGAPYLPSALTNVAARLLEGGHEVRLLDGNFGSPTPEAEIVGLNVVGAPYLPVVKALQQEWKKDLRLVLGGQVIEGLSAAQRNHLFGEHCVKGNDLGRFMGETLPPKEHVSAVSAYQLIPDEQMKVYLSPEREISFYLSQGCVYACTFCAADKGQREQYRNMDAVSTDLAHLMDRAIGFGYPQLSMYLSNLDVFQTPEKLEEFAGIVNTLKATRPGFQTRIRGLATAQMLLKTARDRPSALRAMKEAGLWTVGVGVDGVSADTWKTIKKSHNTQANCIQALQILHDEGILPEAFMVVGHPSDTPDGLQAAIEFLKEGQQRMALVPRPYVAKSFIPGNEGWGNPTYREQITGLFEFPEGFQALDYAAYPSKWTHPSPEQRAAVRAAYDQMCQLPGATTVPVHPIEPRMSPEEIEEIRVSNVGRYDR